MTHPKNHSCMKEKMSVKEHNKPHRWIFKQEKNLITLYTVTSSLGWWFLSQIWTCKRQKLDCFHYQILIAYKKHNAHLIYGNYIFLKCNTDTHLIPFLLSHIYSAEGQGLKTPSDTSSGKEKYKKILQYRRVHW